MLFEKLYKSGKELVKKWAIGVATRKAKIKISSSLNETESQIYDILERQKEMLANIDWFNHIEFWKLEKERLDLLESIDVLKDMYNRLFDEEYLITPPNDIWEYFDEPVVRD